MANFRYQVIDSNGKITFLNSSATYAYTLGQWMTIDTFFDFVHRSLTLASESHKLFVRQLTITNEEV